MSWSEDDRSSRLTVLRIVQLDSAVLDQEILHLLESQLKAVFKYLQAETFRWQPEINLLLRAILWKFTLGKNTATLGQSLFDVRYAANAGDGGLSPINLKAKTVLALIYVTSPWFQERLCDILSLFGDQQSISDKVHSCAKWIEKVWRLASVVNFMVFLQNGTYPSLVERLLGLRHVYNKPQSIQRTSFTFMNREILWHGYAEFIFFVLPLIKMYGFKNLVRRFFGHSSNVPSLEGSNQTSSLSKYCPVCNQLPTQPYVANCGHHFCYYCIKVSCMEDPSFVCPLCNIATSKVLPHQLSI